MIYSRWRIKNMEWMSICSSLLVCPLGIFIYSSHIGFEYILLSLCLNISFYCTIFCYINCVVSSIYSLTGICLDISFFFFFGNLKTHMCPVSSDLFSTCSNSTSLSGCIFSKTASIKMLILLKWNIFLFITRIMFVSFLGHLPYCILYFNYLYICLNFFFFLFLKIATYLLPIFLSW